jgi:hypothetical protein
MLNLWLWLTYAFAQVMLTFIISFTLPPFNFVLIVLRHGSKSETMDNLRNVSTQFLQTSNAKITAWKFILNSSKVIWCSAISKQIIPLLLQLKSVHKQKKCYKWKFITFNYKSPPLQFYQPSFFSFLGPFRTETAEVEKSNIFI